MFKIHYGLLMKVILSIILLGILSTAHAQSFNQDSLDISNVLNKQESCWNEGDIDCFMNGYWRSDSLQFIGKSGITYGWDQTLANYKSKYPDKGHMGVLQFQILHMIQLGPGVMRVTGSWHLDRDIGNAGGYFTLLWKKIKGQWLIIADHSS